MPAPVAHIARDPLDPAFDRDAVVSVLRRKAPEIKRQLLDQTVVSGIGNIYATRRRGGPGSTARGSPRSSLGAASPKCSTAPLR